MASKTGKLILTGAATAALAAGCQTQPLSTTPSMGLGAASSAEYDVLAKKSSGGASNAALQAASCEEARYTVFARSESEVLHFTGSKNVITGDVHTNDALKMAGNADQIKGTAEYVDSLSIQGNSNNISTKTQTGVEPYPFQLDPASFGTPTFDFVGDVNLNNRPEVWASKGVLKSGVYRATGTITLPTSGASGEVTFVAQGVQMPGKNHNLTPFSQGVLIYATGTGNNVVHLSGNSNLFAGLILAPNGAFQMTGNSNSLNGQVYTDAFKISGANNRITYSQYIACPVIEPSVAPSATPSPAPTPSQPVQTPSPSESPMSPAPSPEGTVPPGTPSPGATASPEETFTEASMEVEWVGVESTNKMQDRAWGLDERPEGHIRMHMALPPNTKITHIRVVMGARAGEWNTVNATNWLLGVEENGVKRNANGFANEVATLSGRHTFDLYGNEGPGGGFGPYFVPDHDLVVELYMENRPPIGKLLRM